MPRRRRRRPAASGTRPWKSDRGVCYALSRYPHVGSALTDERAPSPDADPADPALRQALERMAIISRGADLGTWHWNVETGAVVFDERWASMLGYRLDEVVGHVSSWETLVHPDDLPRVRAVLEAHLEGRTPFYDCEHRLRHKDGHWVWVLDRGKVVERAPDGRPLVATGTHMDVSARHDADDRLRLTEQRFRAFIDHSPSYIFAKDLQGRYILANRAYLDLFGYGSETELIGLTDIDRFGHDVDWTANDRKVVETDAPIAFDESARFADGERFYISAKFPLRDAGGRIVAVGGISTDITARKRAEEARTLLMREVDHRAKNVLAGVQALVMLMAADTVPDFKQALLGRIHAMARAHTLLAANRWAGGDLAALIREELAGWDGRIAVEGPPVSLDADLVQVLALSLHELATNAAKYGALSAAGGSVAVRWSLDPPTGRPDRLRLEWIERGGPVVREPQRRGVGTALIEQGVRGQGQGTVAFAWEPDGLVCRIGLPLPEASGT